MNPKIAFFDSKPYDIDIFNEVNKDRQYEIKFFRYHLTPDNIMLAQGYNTVVVFVNDMITASMITQLQTYGVKLIALRCSGFNNIDLRAALGKIKVVRVPAYSPHAIAEHTVALMLSLNRKIHRAYYRTRDANFTLQGLLGFDMAGKTAGIIGTGRIGKVLIKILRGFDMNVLAYDKYPDLPFAMDQGIKYTGLNELFGNSDIISLNCPLTKETEFIVNRDTIAMMKKGTMIINTGRGKLIRTSDLIQGLKSGKISAAGLDVYEKKANSSLKIIPIKF
jgi:D-lactate dehydrogenase